MTNFNHPWKFSYVKYDEILGKRRKLQPTKIMNGEIFIDKIFRVDYGCIFCILRKLVKHRWRRSFGTWYYIVTWSALCVTFSSKLKAINIFPKHILKSKARDRDQSNQVRKKLFCHVIVKNYLSNISRKFFIKIESTWRRKGKEQALQPTLLYRGRTVRSSHRRCCIRKLFLKILQYPQEITVLESIFKNFGDL